VVAAVISDFPLLIRNLYQLGYRGALTIECDLSGPDLDRHIRNGKRFLESIVAQS
jgi:sugar phosphate isomerase/epimerase